MASEAEWKPDPFGRFEFRFHDGESWTEHVIEEGVQSTDPPIPDAPSGAPAAASDVGRASAAPSAEAPESRYMCAKHGFVTPTGRAGKDKTTKVKSVSGGKLATGLATGGVSMLFTGARRNKAVKTTLLVCPKCKRQVTEV